MPRRDRESVRVESPAIRINRRGTARLLNLGALAALVVACPLGMALDATSTEPGTLVASLLHGAAIALMTSPLVFVIAAAVVALYSPSRPGIASVEGDSLRIERDGRQPMAIPVTKLGAGYLRPHGPRGEAHITLPSGNVVEVSVGRVGLAESLLEAAGLDATQRRVTVRLRRIFHTILFWMLGAPTLVTSSTIASISLASRFGAGEAAWPVFAGLVTGIALTALVAYRLLGTVGSDGVFIRHRIGSEFISYREMRTVMQRDGHIWFYLRDGKIRSVWANSDVQPSPAVAVERIEQAREAYARGAGSADGAQALARSGRSIAAWKKELQDAIDRAGSYRDAALTRDDLLKVVSDVAASVEHRIGAALALGSSGSDEDRERVRVVAEATASEPIRVALERAGEGTLDENEIDAAIAAARKA